MKNKQYGVIKDLGARRPHDLMYFWKINMAIEYKIDSRTETNIKKTG